MIYGDEFDQQVSITTTADNLQVGDVVVTAGDELLQVHLIDDTYRKEYVLVTLGDRHRIMRRDERVEILLESAA